MGASKLARKIQENLDLKKKMKEIREAVKAVYYAAHWSPDREVKDEDTLWEKLRDACGFTPGESSKILGKKQGGD